jgi:hypothetical protein
MNILIKVILSVVVIGMAYFAFARIWTKDIDILAFLKKPRLMGSGHGKWLI